MRPALILIGGDGGERRLLADLDDKPWVAEDGESWQAAFAVEAESALDDADRLELSVAPDINVELRRGGVNADGPITATGRTSEAPAPRSGPASVEPEPTSGPASDEPAATGVAAPRPSAPPEAAAPAVVRSDPPADPDLPFPIPQPRRRARGAPPAPPPTAAEAPSAPVAPRPRPAANRAPDVERLTARLRAAEATLEREQERRQQAEQSLERERAESRRMVAELARVNAELELARTAESEAADTAAQLDASRRANHELRARHEALRADHDRRLSIQAELEEKLKARTAELQDAREELSNERRQRRGDDSRAVNVAEAPAGTGPRPAGFHATVHTPPPPRTDRPINPSLRRSPWLRLLVLIVIAGVLLAVYLVLHSTVLH